MVVAWLVGDPRSVSARILPSGSIAARLFHLGHKYIFAERFSYCSSHECLGRDMDGWSWELTERCLIGTTLMFKVREHATKCEEIHLNFYNRC
jgi:hypothetical protein